MKIAIIEDSKDDALRLSEFITTYCSGVHLCQQTTLFHTASDFLHTWKSGAFDLIFIDIFLNNGEALGLQLADRIRREDEQCSIIFTTVSPDFALKGYEVRALDYLVKPISYGSLRRTMDYYRSSKEKQPRHYIEVKESRIMVKIMVDDILYTDYFNHYIQIHLPGRVVRTYMKFDAFSPLLLHLPQFLCCYRNCIINMDKVTALLKTEFIVTSGEHLPIARNLRPQIQQQFADYQFHKLNGGNG